MSPSAPPRASFIPPLRTKDTVDFALDKGLINHVLTDIRNKNSIDSYDEICGNMVVKDGRLVLLSDSAMQGKTEDSRFFCEPRHKIYNVIYHTHGLDPIPSGEDLLIVALNDCVADSTQALVEFLFTPFGVWVFHRTVKHNNTLFKPYVRTEATSESFIERKLKMFQNLAYDICRDVYREHAKGIPIRMYTEERVRLSNFLENVPGFYRDMLRASRGKITVHFYCYPDNPQEQELVVRLPRVLLGDPVVRFCALGKK